MKASTKKAREKQKLHDIPRLEPRVKKLSHCHLSVWNDRLIADQMPVSGWLFTTTTDGQNYSNTAFNHLFIR